MTEELEIGLQQAENGWDEVLDAVEAASSQNRLTWLTDRGRRIAAIVPVDVAEHYERETAAASGTTTARPGSQAASDAYRARRNQLRGGH